MKWTKRTIGGTVAGFVLASGAAFAAVTLFGGGHAAVAAAVPNPLTVDQVQFTSTLLPGGSANVKGVVHNPNDFPVKVTDVIVIAAGAHGVGPDCASLSIGGTSGTFAINGSGTTAAGFKTHLAVPVSIAANGAEYVEVPNIVSQAVGATSFCGFEADVAVVATAGN